MKIFGIDLKLGSTSTKEDKNLDTFSLDKQITSEQMIPEIYSSAHGGMHSIPYEMTQTPTEERQLITNYRELAASAEVDEALQEIRNEIFIFDVAGKKAFELDFPEEESDLSDNIKKKILEEFDYLYHLIDFDTNGVQWFDDWYVDSKLYLHKVIDTNNPKRGIKRVQLIDPMRIRKLRIIPQPAADGTFDLTKIKDMYVYNQGFDPSQYPMGQVIQQTYGSPAIGIQIHEDSITYVNSGLFDRNMGTYVGYLKKAILPYNMLKMMEDAMIIFRVVRAPARRAIYVDVSGLQRNKAEAYIKDLMSKFKNKMVYDTKTGTLSDRRNVMSMQDDYWLPRRDGGKGTEIETIDGQNSQDILEEVEYTRDKLWRALGVPRGRFGEQPSTFQFGKGVEIQRDEYRFGKFLGLLRQRFIPFMEDLLKTQLILKKIILPAEWDEIKSAIRWVYTEDNAFVEFKESEIINNRLTSLALVEPYIGKYYSRDWVKRNILHQSDDDIKEEQKKMDSERPIELKNKKEEQDVLSGE